MSQANWLGTNEGTSPASPWPSSKTPRRQATPTSRPAPCGTTRSSGNCCAPRSAAPRRRRRPRSTRACATPPADPRRAGPARFPPRFPQRPPRFPPKPRVASHPVPAGCPLRTCRCHQSAWSSGLESPLRCPGPATGVPQRFHGQGPHEPGAGAPRAAGSSGERPGTTGSAGGDGRGG